MPTETAGSGGNKRSGGPRQGTSPIPEDNRSWKDKITNNIIWFLGGVVISAVVGTLAALNWLDARIDKRIGDSQVLKPKIRIEEAKERANGNSFVSHTFDCGEGFAIGGGLRVMNGDVPLVKLETYPASEHKWTLNVANGADATRFGNVQFFGVCLDIPR